jgi:hypothetical protein
MKLKPSGGCRTYLAAFVATLASVVQMIAATATITWDNPADIVYGTKVDSVQLNAVATNSDTGAQLTGTKIYTPSAGTFLNAGDQQALKITFIPDAGQGVAAGAVEKTVFVNVLKAPLTATANSGTPEYGAGVVAFVGALGAGDVTYDGFAAVNTNSGGVLNDNAANALSVLPTLTVTANANTKAGTSTVISFAQAPVSSNYNVTAVNGTLTVAKKPLVFVLGQSVSEYGATPAPSDLNIGVGNGTFGGVLPSGAPAGTGAGWENADKAAVKVSQVHGVTVSSPVGDYDITVLLEEITLGVLDNYDIQIENGQYSVTKRNLIVSIAPAGGSVINYGDGLPAFTAGYTIDQIGSAFAIPDVKVVGNALEASAGVLSTPVTLNVPAANANVKDSPHAVSTTGGVAFGGNYTIQQGADNLTVNAVALRIKASNRTKITGVDLPGIGSLQIEIPTPADLKHGDSAASVLDPFPPKLKYDPAVINLAQNGRDLGAGNYAAAVIFDGAPAVAGGNYNLVLQSGDLTVTLQPAQVSWTPQATVLTYGEAIDAAKHFNAAGATQFEDPANPGTFKDLTGTIAYTAVLGTNPAIPVAAGDTPPAGTWVVTATFTPDPGQGVDFGQGTRQQNFTVSKAALKVTANNQTRVFGNVAGFNATNVAYEGFVLGDGPASLTKQPVVADPTAATSNVGDYNIAPAGGESANYAFNYVSGKYTLTALGTAVVWAPEAVDPTKAVVYGTALNTTANLTAAGPAGVDGAISYSVNTSDGRAISHPGATVTATFTPTSANYSASTLGVFLNVSRKSIDVVPTGFSMVYGDDLQALAGEAGFLEGDGVVTTFVTTAVKGSNVGEYFITAKYEDTLGRLKNYTIKLSSQQSNRIEVTPAVVNIETQNKGSGVLAAKATETLKLSGLKAEAAILNGVELSAAQIALAHVDQVLVIGADTYDNKDAFPVLGGVTDIDDLPLLGRVFNGDGLPSFDVPSFSNAIEATFAINTVLDTKTDDGDGISIGGNYTLGNNTAGEYSVGKAVPTINWANAALTYGEGVIAGMLNATVAEAPLNAADKGGSYSYKVGDAAGADALGAKLNAGTHTLHVTYVPHADNLNAFVNATKTVTLTVAKAVLDVRIPVVNNFVYGDPLPRITVTELSFGTKVGDNIVRGFVNGDTKDVFNQAGAIQPVVGIKPNTIGLLTDYSVANSPALTFFGQSGSLANYIVTDVDGGGQMPIARRPLTVKAADVVSSFGASAALGVEYNNLAPGSTSVTPGDTAASLSAQGFAFMVPQVDTATLNPGSYTVFANGAFGNNYTVTHTTGTLLVEKALASINISDNSHAYDTTGKGVAVATVPAGLATIVTYDGAAALPVAAGTYAVNVEVNDSNYQGTLASSITITPGNATVTLGDLIQNYDGSAKSPSVATVPAGVPVSITYNGSPDAPSATGSYSVAVTVTDPNLSGSAEGTLLIEKGPGEISLSNLTQVNDGSAKPVGVTTVPPGLGTSVTYDGGADAPSSPGSYAVVASIVDNDYNATIEGTLVILESATVTLSDLLAEYTGDPIAPTVTTSPAGLTVNVTYNKNPTVPHEVGTYEVIATISDTLYSGSAKSVFRISQEIGTVTFVESSLNHQWTAPLAAEATTDPAGLNLVITYNGTPKLPTEPGAYEVKAVIADRNISGSATATYTLGKSDQNVTFPAIPNLNISGSALVLILGASASSELDVTYTVIQGDAVVDGNLLTISQPGLVSITAQQLGNERFNAAREEVRSFRVTGTGVPLGAVETAASLNDDGSVSVAISGSPFETLSVYAADSVTGEFAPVVKIGLDENGQGSYNSPTEGDHRFFQVK